MTIDLQMGDNREVLLKYPDKHFDCVVTSPPYWGLRDYNTAPLLFDGDPNCEHKWKGDFCSNCGAWRGQLGLEPSPELFIRHLVDTFDTVKYKLKDTGNCFVNLGDTYSGSGGAGGDYNAGGLKEGQPRYKQGKSNLQTKSLCLIPERFAWGMIEHGWILRNKIVWHKLNHMPESVTDRVTKSYEIVYHFVKQQKYYYDLDGIREPHKEDSKKRALRGCSSDNKYTFSKQLPNGIHANTMSQERKYKGYDSIEKDVKDGKTLLHPKGKNPGDVWSITTQPYSKAHFATFPLKLVEKPILAGCPVDGLVLDPFAGSGTVGEFCNKNHRNAVLIELNEEYKPLIVDRTNLKQIPLSEIFSFVR